MHTCLEADAGSGEVVEDRPRPFPGIRLPCQRDRATTGAAPFGADAEGLYFPGASLVLVSSYDRTILGHELAHYLTDHYLKQTPRDKWEAVAHMVERKLPAAETVVATAPAPMLVAAHVPASPAAE